MKVFIVNGQGAVGKSKFEDFVSEIAWKMDRMKVRKTSMINGVKELAKSVGWDGISKENRDRVFLYNLKQLCDGYCNYSYSYTYEDIMSFKNDGVNAVFVDAREKEDIIRLKNDFAAKVILVKRGDLKKYGNAADDNVMSVDYDIIIDNDGTLNELKELAIDFYNKEISNGN